MWAALYLIYFNKILNEMLSANAYNENGAIETTKAQDSSDSSDEIW